MFTVVVNSSPSENKIPTPPTMGVEPASVHVSPGGGVDDGDVTVTVTVPEPDPEAGVAVAEKPMP